VSACALGARAAALPWRRLQPWRRLLVLLLSACASDAASRAEALPVGVGHFKRSRGMPIGTGADGGGIDARGGAPVMVEALEPPPAEVTAGRDPDATDSAASPSSPAAVPCSGCLELDVDVDDINQRDEFVFATNGIRVTRVVWTLLVNFNSDQLAVQPFINDKQGKYTSLHVNTFPLGKPVEIEQEFKGKADTVGLVVGSSGAWTGNQTMSVFVDSVRVEGPQGFTKDFASDDGGLAPRTQKFKPKAVLHPDN
jgi:hypothetical protein